MIPASVGFQCPDDVRAGAATVREPRTVFGGRVSADTSRITIVLVVLNVVVFLAELAGAELRLRFANVALSSDGTQLIGVADGEYYRLLTAAFLHGGAFHLLSNMFALATLGPQLEQVLGRTRYLALYVLSALGGSTLSFLVSAPGTFGVGASGAIFGLFGAYYVVARRTGGDTRSILTLLAINIVITFAVPIIDWRAHLGGLATGAAVAATFAYLPAGPRRASLQVASCVLVALVLLAAVVLRRAALTG